MERADERPIGKDDLGVVRDDMAGERGCRVSDDLEDIIAGDLIERRHEEDPRCHTRLLLSCQPECTTIDASPQVSRGLEGTADIISEGEEGVVVSDNHEMTGKCRRRVHVAVEVPDPVNNCAFLCADLRGLEVPLDTDIVVTGEYPQGDPVTQCLEEPGQFKIFLAGESRDTVLDVPEQYKAIGIHAIHNLKQPLQPDLAPAPEVEPVQRELRLNAEMEIRYNEIPLFSCYDQGRAVADKFQVHNGFTNPFWGW